MVELPSDINGMMSRQQEEYGLPQEDPPPAFPSR